MNSNHPIYKWTLMIFVFLIIIVFFQVSCASDGKTHKSSVEDKQKAYILEQANVALKSIVRHEKFEEELLKYKIFKMTHRKWTFWGQYFRSWLIFFSVMGLVLGGFYLAYLQFKIDIETGKSSESVLEWSGASLKFRSSVIGLVILTLSLGFFYLYVKEVYKITEIKKTKIEQNDTVVSEVKSKNTKY